MLEGVGYAALTRNSVSREIAAGTLRVIRTPERLLSPVYWVTPRGKPVSRAALRFRGLLKSRVGAE